MNEWTCECLFSFRLRFLTKWICICVCAIYMWQGIVSHIAECRRIFWCLPLFFPSSSSEALPHPCPSLRHHRVCTHRLWPSLWPTPMYKFSPGAEWSLGSERDAAWTHFRFLTCRAENAYTRFKLLNVWSFVTILCTFPRLLWEVVTTLVAQNNRNSHYI